MNYAFGNRPIFGREAELDLLRQAYERVSQTGFGEIVLISGAAGYGKTSLVDAFLAAHPKLTYAYGKAEEALQHVPYSTVLKALRGVISASRIEKITSERDFGALSTANHMTEHLIGELQSVAVPTAPLVLVIDDVHWLDRSSMQMMRALSERGLRDLLIIGTCRYDPTCDSGDDVQVDFLGNSTGRVTNIVLKSLALEAIEGLVSSKQLGETTRPLARLIQSVAGGNPFHISLILNVLGQADTIPDLAQFVSDQQNWSLDELLKRIIGDLSNETQDLLELAACIGFATDTGLFSSAAEISSDALPRLLEPAIIRGLMKVEGEIYQFSHDAVREYIGSRLSESGKREKHAQIARCMLQKQALSADQYLSAAEQIVKAEDRSVLRHDASPVLSALETAAHIAKSVGSLESALRYIDRGIELVSLLDASDPYHWEFAERRCAILVQRDGASITDQELERLIERANTALERARAARLQSAILILRGEFEHAIDVSLKALALLGIQLARKPSSEDLDLAYAAMTNAMKELPLENIGKHQRLTDDTIKVAMDLLTTLQSSFFSNDGLKFLHTTKIVELSATHGISEATCYGLAWGAVCLADTYQDYQTALAMAEAAVALSDTNSYQSYRTSALVALDQVAAWLRPLSYALSRAKEALEHGRNSGDVSMACYATNHIVSDLITMGAPLAEVVNEANRGIAMAKSVGFEEVIRILQLQLALVHSLKDPGVEPGTIISLAKADASSEMSPLIFWGYLYEGMSQFYAGRLELADAFFDKARDWQWTTPAHIHLSDLHFYAALTRQMLDKATTTNVDRTILASLSQQNPTTFANKLAFIDAEIARTAGDMMEALRQYERSIATAKNADFNHELALAHERAGRLALEAGLSSYAIGHIREAQLNFQKWGADQQADRLRQEFGHLFEVAVEPDIPDRALLPVLEADTLVSHLLAAAMEYSGATRGQFIEIAGDTRKVVASTQYQCGLATSTSEPAGLTSATVPESILDIVIQSGHPLRYGNALAEAGDIHFSSLQACPARSLLCVPLKDKDRLFAILYLENNVKDGAFTLDTERAIELFVVATSEVLGLKAQLEEQRRNITAKQAREDALISARTELIKNSHVSVLGGMAASLVHEINQPLSAIVTYANAGTRWLKQPVPHIENATNNFAKIEQSSIRASNIISALRALAKQAPANLRFIDLREVVVDVLSMVETDSRAGNVEIECMLVEESSLFVDPIQIQQVVLNLVTNAMDAMEPQNERRSLKIATEIRDSFVVLAVSDTGTGIPDEARDHIFDPFYTTKAKGLGMGLAICKTIAEVHGGSLSIGSTNAAGTTMIFRLPLTSEPQEKH